MDQLRAMRVFARVIDEGGFARAARAMDLAPPLVTRIVAELETHLGARLLNRTTRSLKLTDVGQAYLERVRSILIEVEEAGAQASQATRDPRGHLRVLCPPALAVHQLARLLPAFHAQYPQVTVEMAAPGPVETIDEGYDVTLIGAVDPLQGDFVARRLARSEIITCAAPTYLDRHGRPEHPNDLVTHEAIVPPLAELERGLHFSRSGPSTNGVHAADSLVVQMQRRPRLASVHIDVMYAAALAGVGVAGLPSFVIEAALRDGRLERVLPGWHMFSTTIWAATPSRQHLPARTRAFIDFLVLAFGGQDRDPWLAGETAAPLRNQT